MSCPTFRQSHRRIGCKTCSSHQAARLRSNVNSVQHTLPSARSGKVQGLPPNVWVSPSIAARDPAKDYRNKKWVPKKSRKEGPDNVFPRKAVRCKDWLKAIEEAVESGIPLSPSFVEVNINHLPRIPDPKQQHQHNITKRVVNALCTLLENFEGTSNQPELLAVIYKASSPQEHLFHALSKDDKKNPHRFKELYLAALHLACQDPDMFAKASRLSVLMSAQQRWELYCEPFWNGMREYDFQKLAPKALSVTVYAAAKLHASAGVPVPEVLVTKVRDELLERGDQMLPGDTAFVLWAFATIPAELGEAWAPLQRTLISSELSKGRLRANRKEVSHICFGIARMGLPMGSAKEMLLIALERVAWHFDAQSVANALWALAYSDIPAHMVPTSLLTRISDLKKPTAQDVANILWGLAALHIPPDLVAPKLMQRLPLVTQEMTAQGVANTMWAWAALRITDQPVPGALLRAVDRVADSMSSQNVSITMLALAHLHLPSGCLHEQLKDAVVRVAPGMIPIELADTFAGLEMLQEPLAQMREPLYARCAEVAADTDGATLAAILLSIGSLGESIDEAALEALAEAVRAKRGEMQPAALANALWGLSCTHLAQSSEEGDSGSTGGLVRDVVLDLARELEGREVDQLSPTEMNRIHQADLIFELEKTSTGSSTLYAECKSESIAEPSDAVAPTLHTHDELCQSVQQSLQQAPELSGCEVSCKVPVGDGSELADVLVKRGDAVAAVQVDAEMRVICALDGTVLHPCGATLVRNYALQELWNVAMVSLPAVRKTPHQLHIESHDWLIEQLGQTPGLLQTEQQAATA